MSSAVEAGALGVREMQKWGWLECSPALRNFVQAPRLPLPWGWH